MSKVPKDQIKEQKFKKKRRSDDKFAYRSVIISVVFAIIFFILSLLFNFEMIRFFIDKNIYFDILNYIIKTATPLLFFLFMMVSVGNFKELTGKPLDWKELLLIFILSLGQTLLNLWIFSFTFIGLIIIIIYLYLVQEI
ncbi:MAG: hypothetical protein ACFFEO_17700 [Candidatus Thorarchaeota archaeon]